METRDIEGSAGRPDVDSWKEFRRRYEDEVCSSMSIGTDHKIVSVFNVLERAMKPKLLIDVDGDMLRSMARGCETMIARNRRSKDTWHISWQRSLGQGSQSDLRNPESENAEARQKSRAMKGRPITLEEFERTLDKVPADVLSQRVNEHRKSAVVEPWRFYRRGMWSSGVRLSASMELHWYDTTKLCVVDLDKAHPMLHKLVELEKRNEDRILPMAPEFAEFLRAVPASQQVGFVFNPLHQRECYSCHLTAFHVGKLVTKIGGKSAVVIDRSGGG